MLSYSSNPVILLSGSTAFSGSMLSIRVVQYFSLLCCLLGKSLLTTTQEGGLFLKQ